MSHWKSGKYHGPIVRFYVDGSKVEGQYNEDNEVGPWKTTEANGSVETKIY